MKSPESRPASADLRIPADLKKFTPRDSRVFVAKVAFAWLLIALSATWVLTHGWAAALPAQIVLGIVYAHGVELQHQALHGTGLRSQRNSRIVGFLLGVPLFVSYSRYRALHLLHHRYLGTDKDTEFFDYSTTADLTLGSLFASAFNVRRWLGAGRDMLRSLSPRATFGARITEPAVQQRIRTEYRLMLVTLTALMALSWWLGSPLIVTLWLIPLVFAEPVHFLIELPEHIFCDRTTRDVFKNTRTIKGSRFSFWLTNGNNLHVEHHLRMGVPINKLPGLHTVTADRIENYSPTYAAFYREVLRAAIHRY
ncbi:fatty acid desaturase [Streptomyces sp. NPDC004126]|uniref:fatty acid desaturase n=1 Tax=Streptomyces sp. NPDC004126 TaxID=3390695 RepID=UPI003D08F229